MGGDWSTGEDGGEIGIEFKKNDFTHQHLRFYQPKIGDVDFWGLCFKSCTESALQFWQLSPCLQLQVVLIVQQDESQPQDESYSDHQSTP